MNARHSRGRVPLTVFMPCVVYGLSKLWAGGPLPADSLIHSFVSDYRFQGTMTPLQRPDVTGRRGRLTLLGEGVDLPYDINGGYASILGLIGPENTADLPEVVGVS